MYDDAGGVSYRETLVLVLMWDGGGGVLCRETLVLMFDDGGVVSSLILSLGEGLSLLLSLVGLASLRPASRRIFFLAPSGRVTSSALMYCCLVYLS